MKASSSKQPRSGFAARIHLDDLFILAATARRERQAHILLLLSKSFTPKPRVRFTSSKDWTNHKEVLSNPYERQVCGLNRNATVDLSISMEKLTVNHSVLHIIHVSFITLWFPKPIDSAVLHNFPEFAPQISTGNPLPVCARHCNGAIILRTQCLDS